MMLATLRRTAFIIRPSITSQSSLVRNVAVFSFFDRFKPAAYKIKVKQNIAGAQIYQQIVNQIDYSTFFARYKLPNTYNSWFLVTELHVWMTIARVMALEECGKTMRATIVETLWQDATARAKALQPGSSSVVRKQLNLVSQQFQAALITYDDGLMHDDKSLASSLWERFFDKKCENYEQLEELVEYVRRQMQNLDNLRDEDLMNNPQIVWDKINSVASKK